MESKKNERANYSLDFKLKVLADMYENGLSIFGAAKKFGIKNHYSVAYWEKTYIYPKNHYLCRRKQCKR